MDKSSLSNRAMPCSALQRSILASEFRNASRDYAIVFSIRLEGSLDIDALRVACVRLVQANESFRTHFVLSGNSVFRLVNDVHSVVDPMFETVEVRDELVDEAYWDQIVYRISRPFNVTTPPLIRFCLVSTSDATHRLFVAMHHAVSDGTSVILAFQSIVATYRVLVLGDSAGTTPAPASFSSYVESESAASRANWAEDQAYWEGQLRSGVSTLNSTAIGTRTLDKYTHSVERVLAPEEWKEIRHRAHDASVSRFTILLAATRLALASLGNEERLSILCPVDLRGRRHRSTIGPCINSVPLISPCRGSDPHSALLEQLSVVLWRGIRHRHMPLRDIAGLWRDISGGSPGALSSVGVSYVTMRRQSSSVEVDSLSISLDRVRRLFGTPTPMSWLFGNEGGELRIWVDFDPQVHQREAIAYLVDETIQRAKAWPKDGSQVAKSWSNQRGYERPSRTSQQSEPRRGVADAVIDTCREAPERTALIDGAETVTYAELATRSEVVEGELRNRGIQPGDVVAISGSRSATLAIGMLGILRTGAAYVPIDPVLPKLRMRAMLEGSRPKCCLVAPGVDLPTLPSTDVIDLNSLSTDMERVVPIYWSEAYREREADLAYVMYTSGSTGTPRGVVTRQGGLSNLVQWHIKYYGVTPSDTAPWLSSISFDASVWELWPYLVAGSRVVVGADSLRSDFRALSAWLEDEKITICFLATPIVEGLLEAGFRGTPVLRNLLTGGERLTKRPPPGCSFTLYNNYGPTEFTVVATAGPVASETDVNRGVTPTIGRPIAGTRAVVGDAWARPLPRGVAGELYLAGDGLTAGYLNDPEGTAACFPFNEHLSEAMYKTGDMVRRLDNGELEFLGRQDNQVQVRGVRVECGEIEAVLREHPSVREAVVLFREVPPRGNQLIAYVAWSNQPSSPKALVDHLGARVPAAMIPKTVMPVGGFTLTPSGKIDRDRLPLPPETVNRSTRLFVEEPVGRMVSELWEDVLGIAVESDDDDFFECGGESLLANSLCGALADLTGVMIDVVELYENSRFGDLTELVKYRAR